ncbi:DUF3006 domain-containing protein [bacterium]|nr:DUF3006 domain-containing protein [candidate division CSSED10-310 bacterium]
MRSGISTGIIEKIEKNLVVLELEAGNRITVPVSLFPENIHEGSVVKISFQLDPAAEKTARSRIENLQKRLQNG